MRYPVEASNDEWETRRRIAYRCALKWGLSPADAEDVAQESCVRALMYSSIDGVGATYMNKVAFTVITEFQREGRKFSTNVDALGTMNEEGPIDGYSMQIMEALPDDSLPVGEEEEREAVRRICEAGRLPESWAKRVEEWAMDPSAPDGDVNREVRALRRKLRPKASAEEGGNGIYIKKVGSFFNVVAIVDGRRIHCGKYQGRGRAETAAERSSRQFGVPNRGGGL